MLKIKLRSPSMATWFAKIVISSWLKSYSTSRVTMPIVHVGHAKSRAFMTLAMEELSTTLLLQLLTNPIKHVHQPIQTTNHYAPMTSLFMPLKQWTMHLLKKSTMVLQRLGVFMVNLHCSGSHPLIMPSVHYGNGCIYFLRMLSPHLLSTGQDSLKAWMLKVELTR